MEILVRSTKEIVYMPRATGIIRNQRCRGITAMCLGGTLDAGHKTASDAYK